MCVVSMVSDHFMKNYPTHVPVYLLPDISALIRKAEEYDKNNNQPECPAQDKIDWWAAVQKMQKEQDQEALKYVPNEQLKLF